MKIKVYRTLNKKDSGDDIVSMFQIPITFIKEPKKIKPISDKYFEILSPDIASSPTGRTSGMAKKPERSNPKFTKQAFRDTITFSTRPK